jgi:TPR repeat protein
VKQQIKDFSYGHGAAQDYAQALVWHRKAAEQGHAGAQHKLGVMYRDGHGVTQDCIRAHMWFNLATSRATHTATRDQVAKNRDRAAAMMTPDQIAEAQRMASEWKPK